MAKSKKNPFLVTSRKKKGKRKDVKKTQASASLDVINSQVIAEALAASAAQTSAMKLCRLCETKDGPYLDIFGVGSAIAKKIDVLLPFTISEFDDLPHKICFRCSAKVEELHDFVEKCTRAQNNLLALLGKKSKVQIQRKSNTRKIWEEKLIESNISNEDICNAVIQKAMEGIKNLPLKPLPLNDIPKQPANTKSDDDSEKSESSESSEKSVPIPLKIPKMSENKPTIVNTNQQSISLLKSTDSKDKPSAAGYKRLKKPVSVTGREMTKESFNKASKVEPKHQNHSDSDGSVDVPIKSIKKQMQEEAIQKTEETSKPFNIMDHISIIKVNGVGVLFQCKLCNRNFLKKDVVESHGCAKTGVPKVDYLSTVVKADPPKNPMASVKYITNKVNSEPIKKDPEPVIKNPEPVKKNLEAVETPLAPEVKLRPRIGPASKVKKAANDPSNFVGMKVKPREVTPPPTPPTPPPPPPAQPLPAIEVPAIPGMKSRYRLVPGPNNSFTLVEDPSTAATKPQLHKKIDERRRVVDETQKKDIPKPKKIKVTKHPNTLLSPVTLSSSVIDIDEDEPVNEAPYPVGFFTSPSSAKPVMPMAPKPYNAPVTFTAPAMKKQSYTVVQTGNPSKLLISAKPRPQPAEEVTKTSKGKKRAKHEVKPDQETDKPYNVTIEDAAPPKDAFFTFISLDPLLQPSYVLPTENIIQESQISTSTNAGAGSSKSRDGYECSLCPEKFSREKKLLAHLQSHYNKMDEDNDEVIKPSKKKARKT